MAPSQVNSPPSQKNKEQDDSGSIMNQRLSPAANRQQSPSDQSAIKLKMIDSKHPSKTQS